MQPIFRNLLATASDFQTFSDILRLSENVSEKNQPHGLAWAGLYTRRKIFKFILAAGDGGERATATLAETTEADTRRRPLHTTNKLLEKKCFHYSTDFRKNQYV